MKKRLESSVSCPEVLFYTERAVPFKEVLLEQLSPSLRPYAKWFANYQRLYVLAILLNKHLPSKQARVLDVGCGVLASKVFIRALAAHEVVGVDYTNEFAKTIPALQKEGWLENTSFILNDVKNAEFHENQFDLIIMHDLFYEKGLTVSGLLFHYHMFLKPGGVIIFDVVNMKGRFFWKILGREHLYKSYDLNKLQEEIKKKGLQVLSLDPIYANKRGWKRLLQKLLWKTIKYSKSIVFTVRKEGQ